MSPTPIYHKSFEVHVYEADIQGRARLATLANYFQATAGYHADMLGFGIHELLSRNVTWVLTGLSMRVDAFPRVGETVTVETQPLGYQRIFAWRRFSMLNAQGEILGQAMSQWVVYDIETKRAIRPPEFMTAIMPQIKEGAPRLNKIPELERADREARLRVRVSDLDLNRHVNNAAFVALALEGAFDPADDDSAALQPRALEIAYREQALLGEELLSQYQEAGQTPEGGVARLHRVLRASDGAELVRASTIWG